MVGTFRDIDETMWFRDALERMQPSPPVVDSTGTIINYVAVKRDITGVLQFEEEKARLEEQYRQAQKEESIGGRLAGGVAHDLNNLLFPIPKTANRCVFLQSVC